MQLDQVNVVFPMATEAILWGLNLHKVRGATRAQVQQAPRRSQG